MKIVILTGAGVSAESGISTFRDSEGLWEGHDVMEVASPQGWVKNQDLVLKFYNDRRRQLKEIKPNEAHEALIQLEDKNDVVVITQNVDNLHERAGSSNIVHLHGELNKVRCTKYPNDVRLWTEDLYTGDLSSAGYQLRPHIVWFGEDVPMLNTAVGEMRDADIAIIIGTSLQVYPAASLIGFVPDNCNVYYVDPKPHMSWELKQRKNLEVIEKSAGIGVVKLVYEILS